MLKGWMRDITLAVRARTGLTAGFFIWLAVTAVAALTAFAFLCVAAYERLSRQWDTVVAGLVMAGFFALVALAATAAAALARRRAKERALLERAARPPGAARLLDPTLIGAAIRAGRALGWQRLVPLALLGVLAAQFLRERREEDSGEDDPG
jgi:hypothetical protein